MTFCGVDLSRFVDAPLAIRSNGHVRRSLPEMLRILQSRMTDEIKHFNVARCLTLSLGFVSGSNQRSIKVLNQADEH